MLLATVSRESQQNGVQILHEQEQVARIGGARLELQGFVPSPSLLVLGMYEERPDAGDFGGFGRSEQRVLGSPSPLPLRIVPVTHGVVGNKKGIVSHDRHLLESGIPVPTGAVGRRQDNRALFHVHIDMVLESTGSDERPGDPDTPGIANGNQLHPHGKNP